MKPVALSCLLIGSLLAGCDMESPTEPESPVTEPPATITEDIRECLRGIRLGDDEVVCRGGECQGRMRFENNCSQSAYVSVRWAAYDASGRLLGIRTCQSGSSFNNQYVEATEFYGRGARHDVEQCWEVDASQHETTQYSWVRCWARNRVGGVWTCFNHQTPPYPGEDFGIIESDDPFSP